MSNISGPHYVGLIDTPAEISTLIDTLTDLPTSPPSLYVDVEGVSPSRHGTVSLLQLLNRANNTIHIIDIHILRGLAFTTPGRSKPQLTLKHILEDPAIPKVFFDVRRDSDALYHHFQIKLAGVHDIQLLENASRPGPKRFLNGLAKCIPDLPLSASERRQIQDTKSLGHRYFIRKMGVLMKCSISARCRRRSSGIVSRM